MNLGKGLDIHRERMDQYVITAGSERVTVTINNNAANKDNEWLDIIIFTSVAGSQSVKRGLCKDKFLVNFDGFATKRKRFELDEHAKTYPRAEAEEFCAGLKKTNEHQYRFCVEDYIVGGADLAEHIFKIESRKAKLRARYTKSKKCRRAEDKLKTAKNGVEKEEMEVLVAKACKPKKRSASCKRAQKLFDDASKRYEAAKKSADVPAAVKDELHKVLVAFGAKVNATCDAKKIMKQCRANRKNTLSFLKKQIVDLEERIKKVKSDMEAQKKIKCQKKTPKMGKICMMV